MGNLQVLVAASSGIGGDERYGDVQPCTGSVETTTKAVPAASRRYGSRQRRGQDGGRRVSAAVYRRPVELFGGRKRRSRANSSQT